MAEETKSNVTEKTEVKEQTQENQDGTSNDKTKQSKDTDKTFTQEEVNQMIKDRVAREQKKAEEKAEEAAKLAKMNKDQKAEYEREKMEKELQQLRAEKATNEMRSEARAMLKEKNIDASDELLNFVVKEDANGTKESVDAFVDLLNGMVKTQVKEALRQESPKAFTTSGLTKEDILNIKDDSKRQIAIAQNRQLFN
ncbi:DUF4355 domain-containing protein [Staphylococcus lugdunensis]|uniref:DUF4355 domain-containing protein n=1 Tax=Staphylococcus lugdunensis TaxID=28035 RepID=UPI000A1744F3|nr:DUF4355 domain-containing protein [Staphylococcus lugdunensis]ARJ30534.1 phage capsid protein [Staphylococcus lugdunensis]